MKDLEEKFWKFDVKNLTSPKTLKEENLTPVKRRAKSILSGWDLSSHKSTPI